MAFLLFDLDGTLTDPELGISACIQHAVQALGRATPRRESLRRYIGPPLRQSLGELLETDDAEILDTALRYYRERFSTIGLYENALYSFVPSALAALQVARHRMWVVTSKPTVYASRIVEHFGLAPYFEAVHGSELTGERSDKVELVAHVLAAENLDSARTWMIGDRAHDVRGGRANGTHTAGVLWGYGSEQELAEAGADVIVDAMHSLIAHLAAAQPAVAAAERS
jgi:phosphoglycolate phosphatase